jgi:hypothetical protein
VGKPQAGKADLSPSRRTCFFERMIQVANTRTKVRFIHHRESLYPVLTEPDTISGLTHMLAYIWLSEMISENVK